MLRRDVHRLFDLGLLAVNPDTETIDVDAQLCNYPVYQALAGKPVAVKLRPVHIKGVAPGPLASESLRCLVSKCARALLIQRRCLHDERSERSGHETWRDRVEHAFGRPGRPTITSHKSNS